MALALLLSCEKHEILYNTEPVGNKAEFQLHYFEPVANAAANYIDSVYVNNKLYSSVLGSGQLLPYNGVPGGATGRFFAVDAGTVNFKFYRKDVIVYDKDVTLQSGKQNVFVYDLTQLPAIVDNRFPYTDLSKPTSTAATWETDSICTVAFYNFLYEDATTPYPGKLQYQYQDVRTLEWKNVGAPVAFGQGTERTQIRIVKTVYNSSAYCRIDYRILDENGVVLKMRNSGGVTVDYTDWWTGYVGRAYMHIFSGVRTTSLTAAVRQWTSL